MINGVRYAPVKDALVRVDHLATDPAFHEFMKDITVRLERVELQSIPVLAVAVRAGLFLGVAEVHGYPVARMAADSPTRWGVIT